MAPAFPAHYGIHFTPTIHASIPGNVDPTKVTLPYPFIGVITGAGKGLGYHIALAYAKASATGLSISSRTQPDLDKLEAEIKKINGPCEVLKSICDVQSEQSVAELEDKVRRKWGRVDVVVANAGIISKYVDEQEGGSGSNLPIGILQDNDWSRVLDINLLDGPQTLICSTSLASHLTSSAMTPIAYNVSKIACNRLIEHVANDHGEDGICAYALHPGAVLTPQTIGHKGEAWGNLLSDDEGLAGAMCVWLSKTKRLFLSGRYVSCNWDVDELEAMRDDIVKHDKLTFKMEI